MGKVDLEVEVSAPGQPQGTTATAKAVWQPLEGLKQKDPGAEKDKQGWQTPKHLRGAVEYGITRG